MKVKLSSELNLCNKDEEGCPEIILDNYEEHNFYSNDCGFEAFH